MLWSERGCWHLRRSPVGFRYIYGEEFASKYGQLKWLMCG